MGSTRSHRAICALVSRSSLEHALVSSRPHVFRNADDFLTAVTRRAACSSPARHLDATFIVRGGPTPGVAIVGTFDDAEAERAREFHATLAEVYAQFHYVGYRRAEADVERLASLLHDHLGSAALDEAAFQAIPRGGHVVLGMLSMVLGLRHEQLVGPTDPQGLTIFVDDCAISGYRIRHTLSSVGAEQLVFALLRAPTALCEAVVSAEPRVKVCVAAHPLRDIGRELMGDRYDTWVAEWSSRLGDSRYWVGRPEYVSFAWKEPDRSFVNASTLEREDGWRVVPRELCLAAPSQPQACDVVVQATPVGPLRPQQSIFFGSISGTTVVVFPHEERVLELDEVAASIWRSVVSHGTIEAAVAELVATFDVEPSRAAADVDTLVAELIRRGILVVDTSGSTDD
jgi:hypothetical protein